jgi:predicted aspartyl protease
MIEITVNVPDSPLSGMRATGLIDTGADIVLISKTIARRLGLRHVDDDLVGGISGGTIEAQIHIGCIEITELGFKKTMPLYAVDWDDTSHTVLLGRSLLKYFVFRYDGPSDLFHFSRPIYTNEPDAQDG